MPEVWLQQTQAAVTAEDMLPLIGIYLVIAVVCTALAACVLVWLCRNQGRDEYAAWLLQERKSGKEKGQAGQRAAGNRYCGLPGLHAAECFSQPGVSCNESCTCSVPSRVLIFL